MQRFLLAVGLVFAGCSGGSDAPPDDGRRVLRLEGSPTLTERLMPMLATEYERLHPDVRITISSTGSGDGIRALLDGKAEIAASSREARAAEEEQAVANGYSLKGDDARHIVGVDVVALAVHPSNPLDSLTYDQVIGIFCTGSVDSWSFLGLDDQPIRVLARDESSGTRALFEDFFCGPRGLSDRVQVADLQTIKQTLEADPWTISFVSMTEATGKVIGLRADPQSHPMLPSQQNIIRGAYPLYHDLYAYTAGPATGDAKAFLDWIGSPAGQEIVDEARFVPLFLRPDRLDGPRPLRETIHFEPGSSEVTQRSAARLKLLARELSDRAGEYRHIVLEGYTDAEEPNPEELSRARAQSVADQLTTEIPGLFFEIIPRGATNPIAPNTTPHGRYRNRRVQVYLAAEEAPGKAEGEAPPTE